MGSPSISAEHYTARPLFRPEFAASQLVGEILGGENVFWVLPACYLAKIKSTSN
jgi:hypothetical protein